MNNIFSRSLITIHLAGSNKNYQKFDFMTVNQRVTGSSPVWGSKKDKGFKS